MRRLALLSILLAVATGCRAAKAPPPPPPPPRHLVLITIDTLRADRLGAYGSRTVETPHLDALARDGALALDASVQVPLTRPSHVTLMTGLYPAEHGIRDNVSPALAPEVPTLAERLKAAGFQTAAFVSSVVLSRQSGLARGFDEYSDAFDVEADDARFLNTIQKRGDVPTAEAVAWMESRRAGPMFVWLHLYDPHDPYEPPAPYAARYQGRPYDGEVAWSDELVGRVDAALSRLGLAGETLLVVTSDHGEGLGEHGEAVHGYFVYESTLAVPLLLRGPGVRAGTRIPVTVRGVDVMPTLLDFLGLARPGDRSSGRSFAGALRGGPAPPEEPTYAESLTPLLHFGWSDLRSLREGRFKYIQAPRPELYDLRQDPQEKNDLARADPAKAAALRAALAARLASERVVARSTTAAAGIPPELLEKLGALGYVGAGGDAIPAEAGADPKDKLEDYKVVNTLMREGLTALRENDPARAAARLRSLLGRGIASFEVHYYLARALLRQNQPRAAAPHFQEAIKRLPAYGAAYVGLAECHVAMGDPARALAVLRAGETRAPRDSRLLVAEAGLLRKLEKPREALAAYERALALSPRDPLLHATAGEMYRDAGDPARAIAALREAVRLDPASAAYWNSLGMVLGGNAALTEAEEAFREALARRPGEAQYAYNLGLVLQRAQRGTEAAPFFRKALALDPGFTPARRRLEELTR